MSVKLLWRTDVHLADQNPQSRTDVWKDTIFDKLIQVGQLASDHRVDAVIDGGDFFHQKSPARTSHQTLVQVATLHSNYPVPTYCCVGNHDCVYGDIEYLPQQPLGVLFETGVFRRLYDEHVLLLGDEEVKVRVVGIPYHGVKYDLDRFTSIKKQDEDYLVVVAHVLASKQGGTMFEGEDIIKYDFLETCDADVTCFGHWHKDQGVTQLGSGKWVVNVGSLSRGSLTQDHLERSPAVVLMEFDKDGINLERIDLQVRDAKEVFDLEGRIRSETRTFVVQEFVGSLKEMLQRTGQVPISDKILDDPNIPQSVKEKALLYWERSYQI